MNYRCLKCHEQGSDQEVKYHALDNITEKLEKSPTLTVCIKGTQNKSGKVAVKQPKQVPDND